MSTKLIMLGAAPETRGSIAAVVDTYRAHGLFKRWPITYVATHGFKGGDLLGVVEHLDYLTDLGIDALYFCPIFQSTANHRYHTHDYYQVDPLLGDSLLRPRGITRERHVRRGRQGDQLQR